MTDKKQTEEEWYAEDAKRLNEMARIANELKVVVKVGEDLESKSEKRPLAKVFRKLRKKKNGSK